MQQNNPITIKTTHEGIEVSLHIPKEKQWGDILVLCLRFIVWIAIGGFFGAMVLNILFTYLPYPSDLIAGLKILGGFVGWMSSGILLMYQPAKRLFGKEKIRISPEGITISTSILNVERANHYPFHHILNLRLASPETVSENEGRLLFDEYERNHTIAFCKGISEHEAERLVETVADALMTSSSQAMKPSSSHVIDHIIFGSPPFQVYYVPHTTIQNPDVSEWTLPYTNLRYITVYTATYTFHQVERFLTYAVNTIGQNRLKNQVDVHIYGNPEHVQKNLLNTFTNLCKQVYVHEGANADQTPPLKEKYAEIRTIFFGSGSFRGVNPITALQNPDVLQLAQSMPNLMRIKIHLDTYDFRLLERFLTYAVNSVGQRHLKNHVEVDLYGTPEQLHPNLRNTLTNLCKRVNVHDVHELY